MAGCKAAGVVAHCVSCRDSIVAEEMSVKQVVNKICWMAVQVADCLARGVFLTRGVLAFGWMGMQKAARGAGLMAVTWVP